MTSLFSPTATPTASQPAITASQPVNLQPVGQDALTPGELTTDEACEFSPADAKLVANLSKRRAQIAALKASLIVPLNLSISTPQPCKAKPAHGVFGSV